MAGLSRASELTQDEVRRLDAIPEKWAEDAAGARLRKQIQKGGVMKRKKPTVIGEAVKILTDRGPMHYRDLAKALVDGGRVKPKGKTFPQTLSADLARNNGKRVERVAPGVYKAKENALLGSSADTPYLAFARAMADPAMKP